MAEMVMDSMATCRVSRSVSTLEVDHNVPNTGSGLVFSCTDIAERDLRIFPAKESGWGWYIFIVVPSGAKMVFGQSSWALALPIVYRKAAQLRNTIFFRKSVMIDML